MPPNPYDPTRTRDIAMEAATEIYGEDSWVSNTRDMVGRVISTCIHDHKLIGSITFASHGSYGAFRIGHEAIVEQTLTDQAAPAKQYIRFALASLRPYFAPKAMVYIQACYTGYESSFLKALSGILGVPVVAWAGKVYFESGRFVKKVSYEEGRMVVCIRNMCNVNY
jgi:hypothetical protein